MTKLPFYEKVGYAFGDAAANLVWRGALAYLAVFYTDTFGLTAAAAAMLFLVVRLSDGITDIIMGMIADRTDTKWGKFRPWIIWSTPFLGLFMVLIFTTPDLSEGGKLAYAYFTYIGLTLAYTVNNVPYSMYVFAAALMVLMFISFATTKERISPPVAADTDLKSEISDLVKNLPFIILPLLAMTLFFYYRELYSGLFFAVVMTGMWLAIKKLLNNTPEDLTGTQRDMVDLLTNKPWLILLGMGFLTMMFNGIKYGIIAYYFKYFIGDELMAGQYFVGLLVVSIIGALCTSPLSKWLGRKNLFILSLIFSGLFTGALFWAPQGDATYVFIVGCSAEFFAAIMPTLFFSMLGDSADYSEWKNGRRATGLIYSAGTFVQKTGGGFAGALVLIVLAGYGYDGMDKATIENALPGMKLLMSWIPAAFSFAAAALMMLYPLTDAKQQQMGAELIQRRLDNPS
jgi:GPH family glycoside/pentoside/hexuronide:cation symporter